MSKTEGNPEFKSFEIISLFFLSVAVLLAISPLLGGRMASNQELALRRAESLAYQVLESHRGSRGPASVQENSLNHLSATQGDIGQDPWGRPYHFQFLKIGEGPATKILVWSAGPNGLIETSEEEFASNRDKQKPDFAGDDLGIMVSIK